MNEVSNVSGNKINIQKSVLFLYINNKLSVKEIKKNNPIYNNIKKNKILGFLGGAVIKNLPANAGDMGLSPGPGRSHMPWSN